MPVMTLDPEALEGDTLFRNLVVDDRSDLARVQLNGTLPITAARAIVSSRANTCLQLSWTLAMNLRLPRPYAVKRYRSDAFVEGVEARSSKHTRSEEVLSTQKDPGGDSSSRPRSAV